MPEAKTSPQGSGENKMSNATAKKVEVGNTVETSKMVIVKDEPKQNVDLSLEKKIAKIEELNIVIDKWRKLNEAKKNLNGFRLGADGLSSTVVIKDVSGQEFKTSHNIVVETVLKTVMQVLDEKIAEVESQINFME